MGHYKWKPPPKCISESLAHNYNYNVKNNISSKTDSESMYCAVLCYAVCLLSMWNSRTNEIEMTSITVTSPVYGQSLHSNCNRNQIHNRAFWTHFRILGIIKWRLVWFSLVCTSKDYNRQFNFICINSSVWLWHIFNWFTWFFVQMKCKLLEFVVFYQWQNLPAKTPPFIHISSILWRCHPIIHSKSIRALW